MRRSTALVLGTLAWLMLVGAIVGLRLSATRPASSPPPAVEQHDAGSSIFMRTPVAGERFAFASGHAQYVTWHGSDEFHFVCGGEVLPHVSITDAGVIVINCKGVKN